MTFTAKKFALVSCWEGRLLEVCWVSFTPEISPAFPVPSINESTETSRISFLAYILRLKE